jgi:hypothetical protein
MDVQLILNRLVPASVLAQWTREDEERTRAQRERYVHEFESRDTELQRELDAGDSAVARAATEVSKRLEALRAAEARLMTAKASRLRTWSLRTSLASGFANRMRSSAPIDTLRSLAARVEDLLKLAVPVVDEHQGVLTGRTVAIAGSADARRNALFRLRDAINSTWHLLPLVTPAEFEAHFDAAVAALPAVVPPISVDEWKRREVAAGRLTEMQARRGAA